MQFKVSRLNGTMMFATDRYFGHKYMESYEVDITAKNEPCKIVQNLAIAT